MTAERRYYSEAHLQRAARQIELWAESLARSYRHELWDMVQSINYARDALERVEKLGGEHPTAKHYLEIDVPRRRRWLNAALHILDYGHPQLRVDYVLGDDPTRERLVKWVIDREGIYNYWSGRRPATWMELP
jgi:hypothetical protein